MAKSVWQEDKLNLLKSLVRLVKEDFLTLLQLIFLALIAGAMWFGYQFLNTKIDQINKTVNPDETKAVIESSQRDIKVNDILDRLRVDTDSDRAKFYQFHNGQRSIGQIAFLFVSATHERVGRGVSSEITNLQRLPSSIFADGVPEYLEGKVRCITLDQAPNNGAKEILRAQAVQATCSFGVFDDKDIVGIVTINYVLGSPKDMDSLKLAVGEPMKRASYQISAVLFE